MFGNPRRLVVELRQLTPREVREIAQRAVVQNYIRHPQTVQVLSELIGLQLSANSGLFVWRGERIIMVVLATPQRGQEVTPRPEDLLFYEIIVREIE